jgi:hypothetical protein
MLTVDDYGKIRRAFRDDMTIRELARTFHHALRKIRQVLAQALHPDANATCPHPGSLPCLHRRRLARR